MRQSDSVSEELDTENVQCALDFENTMNELETQLYYRHLPPKEVALRVMEAACKFYDADWCGLIQVDLDLGLWKPLWWHNECQEDRQKPHFEILRASRPGRYAAARLCLEEQSCLEPTGQHSEAQAHHPLHGSVCAAGSSGWQAACLSIHTHSIVL